jgi:hypothetical protein
LHAVGKPVYHKYVDEVYGAWLRDPMPKSEQSAEKLYATKEKDGFHLYEYADKTVFRRNIESRVYRMQYAFKVCVLLTVEHIS